MPWLVWAWVGVGQYWRKRVGVDQGWSWPGLVCARVGVPGLVLTGLLLARVGVGQGWCWPGLVRARAVVVLGLCGPGLVCARVSWCWPGLSCARVCVGQGWCWPGLVWSRVCVKLCCIEVKLIK